MIKIPKQKSSFYSHKENCQCYPCKHKRGEKILHKKTCQCATCKQKRGEVFGINSPRHGKHHTEQTKRKISLAKTGTKQPLSAILKRAKSNCKPREIRECQGGCGATKELLPSEKWKLCPLCVKKFRINQAQKIGLKNNGKNHPMWQGGIAHAPYSFSFNRQLRERVRVRDNFICQLCGVPELECEKRLHVHHIDYNKKNSKTSNLISLCGSCHLKTNHKREYWEKYFKKDKHGKNKNTVKL